MRNYILFYTGRVVLGGNYISFAAATADEVNDQIDFYVTNFGATVSWRAKKAYFLANKANVCALLKNWTVHYTAAFGSQWAFLQDGLFPLESPRETWSNGE
jgi:hypothetical protein